MPKGMKGNVYPKIEYCVYLKDKKGNPERKIFTSAYKDKAEDYKKEAESTDFQGNTYRIQVNHLK